LGRHIFPRRIMFERSLSTINLCSGLWILMALFKRNPVVGKRVLATLESEPWTF